MSVATSTAIAIGVSAASVASAKIASNASKDAAKIQSAGAEQGRQATQTALQPYQDIGKQSLGRLGLNGGPNVLYQPRGQSFQPGQGQAAYAIPQPQPGQQGSPMQGLGQGVRVDPQQSLGSLGTSGNAMSPDQGAPPQPTTAAPQAGELWTIQSPDGETKQFPPAIAQQYIAKGARRLS